MSNLQDVHIDKIETDIMSVLYANIDCTFTQYTLFNKLLMDKYDGENTRSLSPNFKSKFLLVLKNLMSKYDDIKITRIDGTYNIRVCSESDKTPEPIKEQETQQKTNFWNNPIPNPITLDKTDMANMYDYVYENNLNEYLNWTDPWDGNSIYHELVLFENITQIKKLVELDKFNFFIKNSKGLTPIDIALQYNSNNFKQIFMELLVKTLITLKDKFELDKEILKLEITQLRNKNDYLHSDEYIDEILNYISISSFLLTKLCNCFKKNKMFIFAFLISIIAIKLFVKQ